MKNEKSWITLAAVIVAIITSHPTLLLAAQPAPPDPVKVIVENTPLPVSIANTPVAVIPAERAGLTVQGTVAASQVGPWTVDLAPTATVKVASRNFFRGSVTYVSAPLVNQTNNLLVIEHVTGIANDSERRFQFDVALANHHVYVPAAFVNGQWVVHAATQIYLLPGEELQLCCDAMTAFVSGHYEPMPQP